MEQLIKKDCKTGEYSDIYPTTSLKSVIDTETGQTLDVIIDNMIVNTNHIYVPYINNSKTDTRNQIPANIRRKGLWITYVSCNNEVVTEWYNNDVYDDKTWGCSKNWVPYFDKEIVKHTVQEYLDWYKA